MIIDKNWLFTFDSAMANIFTYECDTDENLVVTVDVYELSDINFDWSMSFTDLLAFDEIDIYYNGELVEWESL
jgi:hypothetical protein